MIGTLLFAVPSTGRERDVLIESSADHRPQSTSKSGSVAQSLLLAEATAIASDLAFALVVAVWILRVAGLPGAGGVSYRELIAYGAATLTEHGNIDLPESVSIEPEVW